MLNLAGFGSYVAGGRTVRVDGEPVREIRFTETTSYRFDPNGTFPIEHAYVQWFAPAARADAPPVVLVHGGGLTGAMWETTPDGRPGWLQRLLHHGLEVHVVDNVERGRAGWVPGLWDGEPVLRSMEEAWRLFRLGRPEGFDARAPFPGQRFPVAALETFARGFVPRWTSTTEAQVAALGAVLERLGTVSLGCHSQGGQVAFEAAARSPRRVAGILAVEPSGFASRPEALSGVPITLVHGDHLGVADESDPDGPWAGLAARWEGQREAVRAAGGTFEIVDAGDVQRGHSHLPMSDAGSDALLDALVSVLTG